MPRPILCTIHPQAIRHNLERVRSAAKDANLLCVTKANAYGHGIEHAFEGMRAADGFAVVDLEEAQRLRRLGVERFAVQCVRTARMLDDNLAESRAPYDQQRLWERMDRLFPSFVLRG